MYFAEFYAQKQKQMQITKVFFNIPVLAILTFPGTLIHAQNKTLTPGKTAPFIELKNIDNRIVSFDNYPAAKGFIIVFISNTCPYSKAYNGRIIALQKKYGPMGFPIIAINSNDPESSPGDSFNEMIKESKRKSYEFPYLFDETQQVAKMFGATNTPHVFVLKRSGNEFYVSYIGTIYDNARRESSVTKRYAEDAINAILEGKEVPLTKTKAIGCGIKWKDA